MATSEQLHNQGVEALKNQNLAQAQEYFAQSAKLQNLDLAGLLREAEANMDKGNVEEAMRRFLTVMEANPTELEALLGLARGALYMNMGEEAELYLKTALRMYETSGEAHALQGILHESRGEFADAKRVLAHATSLEPNHFLVQYNYGRILAQMGEFAPAVEALHKATQLDPTSYDAFYILGMACAEAGKINEAVISFNNAVKLKPNVDAYATLADVLVRAKDLELSFEVLNAGMNKLGEHPTLLEKAAAVCALSGKFGNAVEYLELVVAKVPDYSRAWINLAGYYLLTQDLEKSEEAAKRAVELEPDAWQGHFHLGNLYEAVKLTGKSEQAYRKAMELAPNEYKPIGNLGALLIQVDDKKVNEEAVSLLEKTITMVPSDEWRFHYNLALAYGKLGYKSKARDLLDNIIAAVPQGDETWLAAQALMKNLFSTQDQLKMNQALSSMLMEAKRRGAPKSDVNKLDDGEPKEGTDKEEKDKP